MVKKEQTPSEGVEQHGEAVTENYGDNIPPDRRKCLTDGSRTDLGKNSDEKPCAGEECCGRDGLPQAMHVRETPSRTLQVGDGLQWIRRRRNMALRSRALTAALSIGEAIHRTMMLSQ
jgi:hypothetical protein